MEHWVYIFGQVVADTSDGMEKSFSTILDHTFLYILGPRVYKNSIYIYVRRRVFCVNPHVCRVGYSAGYHYFTDRY